MNTAPWRVATGLLWLALLTGLVTRLLTPLLLPLDLALSHGLATITTTASYLVVLALLILITLGRTWALAAFAALFLANVPYTWQLFWYLLVLAGLPALVLAGEWLMQAVALALFLFAWLKRR